jgi:hypothetical protein
VVQPAKSGIGFFKYSTLPFFLCRWQAGGKAIFRLNTAKMDLKSPGDSRA